MAVGLGLVLILAGVIVVARVLRDLSEGDGAVDLPEPVSRD